MAAPALTAATRLIPLSGAASGSAVNQNGEEENTRVESPGVAAADRPRDEDTMLAAPAPATAAALANGRSQSAVATPPPAAPPSRAPSRPGNGQMGGARSAPLSSRPGGSRELPPLRTMSITGPSRMRRLIPILIGLSVVVVIVVALLIVTQSNSSSTTVHRGAKVSARSKSGAAPAVNPASVTVAVLNGTTVTNLAHDVSSRLATDGYKQGTIATAAAQTNSTTTVAYLPGHQTDARAVAAVLNLKTSAVKPIDQQAMGVACPNTSSGGGSSCPADVVVTVGNDLASLASSPTG